MHDTYDMLKMSGAVNRLIQTNSEANLSGTAIAHANARKTLYDVNSKFTLFVVSKEVWLSANAHSLLSEANGAGEIESFP